MVRSVRAARLGVAAVGVLLGGWAVTAFGQEKENPATKAVDRKDKNWVSRHEKFVSTAKAGGPLVVFLGDSITAGWEGNGKDVWKEKFAPLKAVNLGIGGDRTQHVLWRITEGKELDGIDPKAFVVMIGTNNTGSDTPDQIADGVKAIVAELRKQKPKAKVLLLGVFPRGGGIGKEDKVAPADKLNPKIKAINERIAKLDDGQAVRYLDIGGKFLDEKGGLSRDVMYDLLHLTKQGYEMWAEAIEKPLAELMRN